MRNKNNEDPPLRIHPKPPDADGLRRYTVSVYYYFGGSFRLVEQLEKLTGLRWKHLGTYMDVACFATPEEVTETMEIPFPNEN